MKRAEKSLYPLLPGLTIRSQKLSGYLFLGFIRLFVGLLGFGVRFIVFSGRINLLYISMRPSALSKRITVIIPAS